MASAAPLSSAAAAAALAVDDFFPFAALPPALAHKIFAALPADTRLRCAEVCTAWCAAVAERSLWTRLDLSETSGVTHRRGVTPALLRAAAAKARGALTALDVSGVWEQLYVNGVLRGVLGANAATLRELRCLRGRERVRVSVPDLEALLSAAPQLRVCEADVMLNGVEEARRVLRNEGVFGPLRSTPRAFARPAELRTRSCLPTWRRTRRWRSCGCLTRLFTCLKCWTRSWTLRYRSRCCTPSHCSSAACHPPVRRLWRAC
jgi:hypothetical protein